MVAPKCSDADFIEIFERDGPSVLSRKTDTKLGNVYRRRRNLERKYNRTIYGPEHRNRHEPLYHSSPERLDIAVNNGTVIIGSDLHAWPGKASTAFRAFLKFIRKCGPSAVILNGDVIDGSSISRHPPIGWEKLPTLIEEIEAAQERLHEVELAAGKKCSLLWPLGNHDARFSTRLATVAAEYAKIHGTALKDHFGDRWQPCWSVRINDDVVVKHRLRGGIHATHNNTLWSGMTTITGHLHSLKVTPFSDYNGTRFGVDCGCLADCYGPQFRYAEDNPRNWRSGFIVLTFKQSQLLWPEIVSVRSPNEVEFRGEIISV